ncbi:MAG: sulfatase-like hydrolase/transferase, partial [Desulfatiglandaceae bacterium]
MFGKLKRHKDFYVDGLHIFVLVNFALAQPLFDLLSQNAEFFVARRSQPVDIFFLISILCILVPGALVFAEALVGLIGKGVRRVLHILFMVFLTGILFLPVFKKIGLMPDSLKVFFAFFAGGVLAFAYVKIRHVRTFLTVLSPVVLIFPGLFLLDSPVFSLVSPDQSHSDAIATIKAPPPIIMVVLDEFASTALQDAKGNIDKVRYPHFATLSKDAYWFRNATTVADETHIAIPAVLTGNYVKSFRLPNAASYPRNLFTLLGGQYRLKVFEKSTHLCPDRLFKRENDPFPDRMESLLEDLSVVYLHIVLPHAYTKSLPDISQNWKNFRTLKVHGSSKKDISRIKAGIINKELKALKNDRIRDFRQFVDSIRPTKKPTMYFLHSLLPHVPYIYLPSGKRYTFLTRIEGLNAEKWEDDNTSVVEAYRRFLLQVGCVDTLLGELVNHLKKIGLYERSLIIITADHGVGFHPNGERRHLTERNSGDILPVPLFIKVPHQQKGVTDDHNVESIDILPTVAKILGVHLPGKVDGHAAIDASFAQRKKKIAYNGMYKRFVFPEHLAGKSRTLRWKLAYLGTGAEPPRSQFGFLQGERVSDIGIAKQAIGGVQLDQEVQYEDIDPESHFVPAQIKGSIVFDKAQGPDRLDLVVAVNGIVRTVTGTFWRRGNRRRFSTVVPESSFVKGKNRVRVFIAALRQKKVELLATRMDSAVRYFLKESGDNRGESICSKDRIYPVMPEALKGFVDSVR